MKASFITWHPSCRRSDSLAAALGGKSHLIHYLTYQRPWQAILKYPLQTLVTFVRLIRDKPDLALVTLPPVLAGLPVYLYARIRGIPFIIDAHTGVFDNPRWVWFSRLSRCLSRRAVVTMVTSDYLARIVESWGSQAFVIGDLPVTFADPQPMPLSQGFNVAVICSFYGDEPLEAVIQAARGLPDVSLYITGDLNLTPRELLVDVPENVHFTGWVSEETYSGLLMDVNAVMVLTTRNHTMQRGGYEAMTLDKPLITSDWPLLRQTFCQGTIYVDNTAAGIVSGLKTMICHHEKLALDMRELRLKRHAEFQVKLDTLLGIVAKYNRSKRLRN